MKDIADLYAAEGNNAKTLIEDLKSRAVDALDLAISEAPGGSTRKKWHYTKENILPLLSRLEDEGEKSAAIEDVARSLKLKTNELRRALKTEETQEIEPEKAEEADVPEPGTERYERAMKLLLHSNLLTQAAADMERLGHVGESKTKQLAIICALSARAGNPIQPSTHAPSSSGKNALWDTTLSLLPPEMVVSRSALSAKALYRTEAKLKGGVLYIQEMAGSEDAEYTIRVMQSGNCLEYEATEKMPNGEMRNVVHRVEGPTVIVQTTTKNHLHPENETRVFPIYIDESEQQTKRIIRSVLTEAAGRGISKTDKESVLQVWRDAVRLLEPGEVVMTFAERIEMPTTFIRIRRDARRLINVVRVVAWLHQHQRARDEEGHILATEDDFHTALKLVKESLTRAWQTLTPAEQRVLEVIQDLPNLMRAQGFKRRDLKVPGVSIRRLKEILKSLVDNGYLDCDGSTGPRGFTYTEARPIEEVGLGISLCPPPNRAEPFTNQENISGESSSPDSAQSLDTKESILSSLRFAPDEQAFNGAVERARACGATEEEIDLVLRNRASGDNGRNGHRPIHPLDLEDLGPIGQTGGDYLSDETDAAFNECADFFDEMSKEGSQPITEYVTDEQGNRYDF
jgi:hypothetical protein